ncbi:MAG: hypothetical protein R3B09_23040 [Nannocystaceae bacterium]
MSGAIARSTPVSAARRGGEDLRAPARSDPRRSPLAALLVLVLAAALAPACDPGPRPSTRAQADHPDKERLYGDPTLVPTRAGERAREELALAGEIERLIAEAPEVAEVRAHVRVGDDGGAPTQIVVVARARGGETLDRERCARLALAVVGDDAARVDVDVVSGLASPEGPARDLARELLLALALLALGASAGITVDRARRGGRRR